GERVSRVKRHRCRRARRIPDERLGRAAGGRLHRVDRRRISVRTRTSVTRGVPAGRPRAGIPRPELALPAVRRATRGAIYGVLEVRGLETVKAISRDARGNAK